VKRVLCCSVTEAGARLARRLPFEHRAGNLADSVKTNWESVDAFVLVAATGIAVRTVGPLLGSKRSDPAVVCVDDLGRYVIALCGGHSRGGNALATEVASAIGATAVVTTATDAAGLPALDELPGYTADGDVAGVTRLWLDGHPPTVEVDAALGSWPIPATLPDVSDSSPSGGLVTVTDSARTAREREVLLRPECVVIGAGASTGADPERLGTLAAASLGESGVHPSAVVAVATIDRKATEPAITELAANLGVPVVSFTSDELSESSRVRDVPNPSAVVAGAVGTPSVAEAAALLAAGPGSALVAEKRASADSTVAVARRARPPGHLAVVGLGPGDPMARTPEAAAAVRHSQVVIGYGPYVELASDLLSPAQEVIRSPIGSEAERCRQALRLAAAGSTVALVCSGDPGVYAMASLVFELARTELEPPVTVVPGVTAALSAAAVLGAPLGHDHASISLSDLLTPWTLIRSRLEAAALGDFVTCLYNPRSRRRTTQLAEALSILSSRRHPDTPAAILTDVGRPGETVVRSTISSIDPEDAGMTSLVVVGSSSTRWIGNRMVTPRGYAAT
jgi:cobalt-precorrin 5A hydrolase / precorrin-3B C17-methyltransferase